MKELVLGSTEITTPKNAFGALPVQRVSMDEAVKILRKAYDGGMTYYYQPVREDGTDAEARAVRSVPRRRGGEKVIR